MLFKILQPAGAWLLAGLLFFTGLSSCGVFRAGSKADKTVHYPAPVHDPEKIKLADSIFMEAMQDVMLGREEEAIEKFERVAELQPQNATSHFQLSKLNAGRNDLDKAMLEIKKAYHYDSTNRFILEGYAALTALNGEFEKSAALYGTLARLFNNPQDYLLRQSIAYQQAGNTEAAIQSLDALAHATGSEDETLLLQKYRLYFQSDNMDSAIAINQRLIEFYPKKPDYLLMLGNTYIKAEQKEAGLKAFLKADSLFPSSTDAHHMLLQYYLLEDQERLRPYLEEVLFERQTPVRDKIDLLGIFLTGPSTDTTRQLARDFIPRLAVMEPPDGDVLMLYGALLEMDSLPQEATVQYKKAIQTDPSLQPVWQRLIVLLGAEENIDSLQAYTEQAAQIFPEHPAFLYYNGYAALLHKQYSKAIENFENCLNHVAAEDTSLRAQVYGILGDLYQQVENPSAAEANYQKALALTPESILILNNYSYFLSEQGTRLEEAERMSAKTLESDPEEATYLDTYGWILFKLGRLREAKAYIEKALAHTVGEESAVIREHLGDIEHALGNRDAALLHWEAAKAGSDQPDTLLKKINALKNK